VYGSRDERIRQIAEAQRGRVSTRQLYAAGISSGAISRRLASSRLIRLHRCVFAVGHLASTPLGDETAALLAVGSTAVLSHRSAAQLLGLIEPQAPPPVHVTLPVKRSISLDGVVIHRTALLMPRDIRIRHGLPVMSPARALLDLAAAAAISDRELELAFDRGIVERVVRPADLAELVTRAVGHPGRGRLAALLSRQTGQTTMTRSEAEERVLALIRGARLPMPLVNARLGGYEVDFLWPDHRLVLEVDGFRFHTTRAAFERDRRKDADLRRAEIEVLRTTWRAIEGEPYVLVADVAREVSRAESRARPARAESWARPESPREDPRRQPPDRR
jgi:very-short-patch-repair endonuclease